MTQTRWPRETLEQMTRDELLALAAEHKITVPKSITKAKLLDVLDPPGEKPAADDAAGAAGAAEEEALVALIRRFLADPKSVTSEEATVVNRWSSSAAEAEYDHVMGLVRGERLHERSGDGQAEPQHTHSRSGDEGHAEAEKEEADVAAPGTDVELVAPPSSLLPSQATWSHIMTMASDMSKANIVPGPLRGKPADIAIVLLAGRDVGVSPTTALQGIHVIDGKPSMAAVLMRGLIIERGHDVWFEEETPTSVTICGHRSNWPAERVARVTWTLEKAKQANLIKSYDAQTGAVTPVDKREVWRKYTTAMLKARATSEMGRDNFPDVLLGLNYTPEELGADVDEQGEPIKVASTATTVPSSAGEEGEGEAITPEEEAQRAGWESLEAERAAHRALRETVTSKLTEEQRKTAREMRGGVWPLRPKSKFDAFAKWVEAAVKATTAEDRPTAESDDKTGRLAAARAVVEEAEGRKTGAQVADGGPLAEPTKPSGRLNDVAEVVCPSCGTAGESLEAMAHQDGCPEAPF